MPPGLAGVAVTATTVGDVLGDEGIYHYRGRSAAALATSGSFEEAAAIVLDASGEPAIGDATLPSALADLVGRVDLRGGLSALGELMLAPARDRLERALPGRGFRPGPAIVSAELGPQAGLVGAADLARLQASSGVAG